MGSYFGLIHQYHPYSSPRANFCHIRYFRHSWLVFTIFVIFTIFVLIFTFQGTIFGIQFEYLAKPMANLNSCQPLAIFRHFCHCMHF